MSRVRVTQQDVPDSGERVMMPPERSRFNKPVKPMTSAERSTARRAEADRQVWESTPEGRARTTGMEANPGANVAQQHMMLKYDTPADVGPRHYDRQLPGMADPNQAPRPPKWEELSDAQRSHTERALKLRGTSIDRMTSDFGAQLDQAAMRAARNNSDEPYASRFYESGEPRKRIDQSAHELGVPAVVHAMTNAFTSPNTKFSILRADGSTSYPNDEAAVHATRWVQQGGDPDKITNELSTTGTGEKRAQGYVTNIRKAAHGVSQHLQGVEPADWRLGSTDKSPFETAPKTGPYANSWSDSHPQFTVADVHTGGGGAFPHLGYDKPVRLGASGEPVTNASGKEQRLKSGREQALASTPFAHSAVDYAARQAAVYRGEGSVRRAQATQWGEEQLQRGESGLRGAPTERKVYPASELKPEIEGQLNMFSRVRPSAVRPELPKPGEVDRRSEAAKRAGTPF